MCKSNAKVIDKQLAKKDFFPKPLCYDGERKLFTKGIYYPNNLTIWLYDKEIYSVWCDYYFNETHLEMIRAVQNSNDSTYEHKLSQEESDKEVTANIYTLTVDKQKYEVTFYALKTKGKVFSPAKCEKTEGTSYRVIITEED